MMYEAYSRLKRVLRQRNLSVPELQRRILLRGVKVNLKSLYRLSDEQRPLERLDMRVTGAICAVCDVSLSELISFEETVMKLQRLPATEQTRLDMLMTGNNEGKLTPAEREELRALVEKTEKITLQNARILQEQQRQLAGV